MVPFDRSLVCSWEPVGVAPTHCSQRPIARHLQRNAGPRPCSTTSRRTRGTLSTSVSLGTNASNALVKSICCFTHLLSVGSGFLLHRAHHFHGKFPPAKQESGDICLFVRESNFLKSRTCDTKLVDQMVPRSSLSSGHFLHGTPPGGSCSCKRLKA